VDNSVVMLLLLLQLRACRRGAALCYDWAVCKNLLLLWEMVGRRRVSQKVSRKPVVVLLQLLRLCRPLRRRLGLELGLWHLAQRVYPGAELVVVMVVLGVVMVRKGLSRCESCR
jgi:hypothetical protein